MHDNGLLDLYPKYSDEDGFLKVTELVPKKRFWKDVEKISVREGKLNGLFYVKKCCNLEHVAEILESQIFADFIPGTAIYTPVKIGEDVGVISNNVCKGSRTMYSFLEKKALLNDKSPYMLEGCYSSQEMKLNKIFTNEGYKQYGDMHLLDVGCGNIDRHPNNFNVVINNNLFPLFSKACALRLYDFGSSVDYLYGEYEGTKYSYFCNGLGGSTYKTRDQMIELFKTKEFMQSVYTNSQMAEILGGIDVHGKVEDIKETMGFQVPQEFEDKLCFSLDYVAEGLIK